MPRTRQDWWRAWKRIKPVFDDVDPSTVSPELIGHWYGKIKAETGLNEAHRALKIWRALWKIMTAFKLCVRSQDPSLTIRNRGPKGRSEVWAEG